MSAIAAAADPVMAIALVGLLLLAGAAVAFALDQRRRRRAIQESLEALVARVRAAEPKDSAAPGDEAEAPGHADEQARREDLTLQRRIGQLHLAKLESELELLRRQVASKELDDDRTAASKEYHELMVEKARLEIDSLRLHIAEQRRRMDVWRDDDSL